MKKLSFEELCLKIKQENVNYISFAYTAWHIIGAKSVVQFLNDHGSEITPLYLVLPHYQKGMLVTRDEDVILYEYDRNSNPTIGNISYIKYLLELTIKKQSTEVLYVSSSLTADFEMGYLISKALGRSIEYIVYDEGLKSYIKKYGSWQHVWKHTHRIPQTVKQYLENKTSNFLRIHQSLFDFLPLKKNGVLEKNECVISSYKKTMNLKTVDFNYNNIIVVLQEPKEFGLRLLGQLIPLMLSNGYNVYIKPHPRFPIDNDKLSGSILLDSGIALEKLQKQIKAKYILGFTSTSLLSMDYLFKCKSISLTKLLDSNEVPDYIKNAYLQFEDLFSFICKFPSSEQELMGLLKK